MAPSLLTNTFQTRLKACQNNRVLGVITSQKTVKIFFTLSSILAKSKRRSKNDVDGRDFKCKYCDKTYLSYPALYTHMKQKHSKGPDGEVRTPPTSGRGRGRPRKNVR